MSAVQIKHVLHKPIATRGLDSTFFDVSGWVYACCEDVIVKSVELISCGALVGRLPVNVRRPDLLPQHASEVGFREECGFFGAFSSLLLGPAKELVIRAVCVDSAGETSQTLELTRISLKSPAPLNLHRGHISPILVCSNGRSGSTLLMSLLKQIPEVAVTDIFPYEVKQASFWLHSSSVTAAPASLEHSAHPDSFAFDQFFTGRNPFSHSSWTSNHPDSDGMYKIFSTSVPDQIITSTIALIDRFYLEVSALQNKVEPRYYAEKTSLGVVANTFYSVYEQPRTVILVRDFRDWVCSIDAFNTKRGHLSWGQGAFDSTEKWLRHLSETSVANLISFAQETSGNHVVVKYENLLTSPAEEVGRIADYLNLELSRTNLEKLVEDITQPTNNDFESHGTSKSLDATMGRWKNSNLASPQTLTDTFYQQLKFFNYL